MAAVPPRLDRVTAVVSAVAVASLLVSGCYWLRYRELALTHVELIEQLAEDALAAIEVPGILEPSDIARLSYPLERAREFARVSRARFAGELWLELFEELLGSYQELVAALDRERIVTRYSKDMPMATHKLRRMARNVIDQAAAVRNELAEEGG